MTNKVKQFAEKKRQDIIVNIQNSSAVSLVLKWIFTNKVSVALFIVICVMSARYAFIEYEFLQLKNEELVKEKIEFIEKTKELQEKVKKLESDTEMASKVNDKVKEKAESLTVSQKKRKILQQIRTLKSKRGLS